MAKQAAGCSSKQSHGGTSREELGGRVERQHLRNVDNKKLKSVVKRSAWAVALAILSEETAAGKNSSIRIVAQVAGCQQVAIGLQVCTPPKQPYVA